MLSHGSFSSSAFMLSQASSSRPCDDQAPRTNKRDVACDSLDCKPSAGGMVCEPDGLDGGSSGEGSFRVGVIEIRAQTLEAIPDLV